MKEAGGEDVTDGGLSSLRKRGRILQFGIERRRDRSRAITESAGRIDGRED